MSLLLDTSRGLWKCHYTCKLNTICVDSNSCITRFDLYIITFTLHPFANSKLVSQQHKFLGKVYHGLASPFLSFHYTPYDLWSSSSHTLNQLRISCCMKEFPFFFFLLQFGTLTSLKFLLRTCLFHCL